MTALWTAADVVRATGGRGGCGSGGDCGPGGGYGPGGWTAADVSIDTRSLVPGDLFVALRGPNHDGHDFVAAAFAGGAAAAIVDHPVAGTPAGAPLIEVGDTLDGLVALGAFARARSRARIIAVTGSVGKTGTKEALRLALGTSGATFASAGSLNNHWGVPLSLARLPPAAAYGVFELGMNHPGEIARLVRQVRPHVAVITTVEPVHLGHFDSVEAIATAKAEIFLGLEPGGIAVLNRDNPHYPSLAGAAAHAGAAAVIAFGSVPPADPRLLDWRPCPGGSVVEAEFRGSRLSFRLGIPGRHWAINALAVLAAAAASGADPRVAATALQHFTAMPGRGRRHDLAWHGGRLTLIDESYNASPAAMDAALRVLGDTPPGRFGRRVAVLGDMLELGDAAPCLHRALAGPIAAAGVDRVFLVGSAIAALDEALPAALKGGLWPSADQAIPALVSFLEPGDVVTVKGSYGVHVDRIVTRLIAEAARSET
ncbi:MAG TPA: UDP-N-acetylmuramoyl-tripeptide--D-alanyl-D-alanine ligase [Stellaceae bacterium]|nr:UDP-N-acetylmuramoyl-tripeptide--D-alanyl-D-alanine ligase [Stellaceae bacterium]